MKAVTAQTGRRRAQTRSQAAPCDTQSAVPLHVAMQVQVQVEVQVQVQLELPRIARPQLSEAMRPVSECASESRARVVRCTGEINAVQAHA